MASWNFDSLSEIRALVGTPQEGEAEAIVVTPTLTMSKQPEGPHTARTACTVESMNSSGE